MNILSDCDREKIKQAITDDCSILLARKMKAIKCPKCGSPCAHCHITDLSEQETGTRQGGYLIEFDYECSDCPPFQIVIAEHKGTCVVGNVVHVQSEVYKRWAEENKSYAEYLKGIKNESC